MPEWIDVCALEDVPAGGARRLRAGGTVIALIRPDADRVFALEDRCPHKGGPLSEGIVAADHVACPLHGQCVDLASGTVMAPDEGQVRIYGVRIAAGRIWLRRAELAAPLAPASEQTA
jgi:nitrite reductase (NADH) small subunit